MRRTGRGGKSDFTGGHTMSRQRTKTEIMRHEQYFAKLIEKADNAMREYQQERGGEHRLYVDEYIRRKGFLLGQ